MNMKRTANERLLAAMLVHLRTRLRGISMRKTLTIFAIIGGIGLAVTMASDLLFSGGLAVQAARGVTSGVILGSNAWPSVPVDVKSRLALAQCNEQGQCGSANLADD
jgi:hypothetical protein